MPFNHTWKHGFKTVNGRDARIVCVNRRSILDLNLVVLVADPGGNEDLICYRQDGTSTFNDAGFQLVNVPHTIFGLIHRSQNSNVPASTLYKTEALRAATVERYRAQNIKIYGVFQMEADDE